ncbi:Hypothetical protein NTJ_15443 [Nesidiocoris tenuis]|uniref:Uncharacterized protein n=1 Tax=Nesidiocoris tenuis TaxID=355587 RepID=A0ABN7BE28_9HEMI|nr:Hypothetical protein NTJ_15443 [Nesidiocoris tenuis]
MKDSKWLWSSSTGIIGVQSMEAACQPLNGGCCVLVSMRTPMGRITKGPLMNITNDETTDIPAQEDLGSGFKLKSYTGFTVCIDVGREKSGVLGFTPTPDSNRVGFAI